MEEETKPQAPQVIEPLDDDRVDAPNLCLPMATR